MISMVNGLLLLTGIFAAAGSIYALLTWPLWWLPAAFFMFVATLLIFGYLKNCEYSMGRHGPLHPHHGAFSKAMLVVGYLFDYLLNATVFTVIMLLPPLETTVTERLNKYGRSRGWWGLVARYFGKVWINPLELTSRPHVDIGEGDRG